MAPFVKLAGGKLSANPLVGAQRGDAGPHGRARRFRWPELTYVADRRGIGGSRFADRAGNQSFRIPEVVSSR